MTAEQTEYDASTGESWLARQIREIELEKRNGVPYKGIAMIPINRDRQEYSAMCTSSDTLINKGKGVHW